MLEMITKLSQNEAYLNLRKSQPLVSSVRPSPSHWPCGQTEHLPSVVLAKPRLHGTETSMRRGSNPQTISRQITRACLEPPNSLNWVPMVAVAPWCPACAVLTCCTSLLTGTAGASPLHGSKIPFTQ